jgi:hypothetical protein
MNGSIMTAPAAGVLPSRRHVVRQALLRSEEFDVSLVGLSAFFALAAGAAVTRDPRLFVPILVLDVWLLGYQHVVATYTRLMFDTESFSRHRFLALGLPVLVAVATFGAAFWIGPWVVASTYLYWQWFHYTRQSYGIGRMYLRKVDPGASKNDPITFGVVYMLPLWGILQRSAEQPAKFLNLDLVTLPVPWALVKVAAILAITSIAIWIPRELLALRRDVRRLPYIGYMASHLLIFSTGYLLIADINVGWLVLNIWHNFQYLFIVWMFNANRFKGGIDARHRFISTISQPQSVMLYVATSLILATLLYGAIRQGVAYAASDVLGASFAVYMTINFHHYLVDAIIWRRKHVSGARTAPLPI